MDKNLAGKTLAELEQICSGLDLPGKTAGLLAYWLYKRKATTVAEMESLPKISRSRISELYSIEYHTYIEESISNDSSRKYLFPVVGGKSVESALIPEGNRITLCVSSQVGCKMGCAFCQTGKQGFQGNLDAADMMNQIMVISRIYPLTHIVFMGMGEPLDNLEAVLPALDIITSEYGLAMSPRNVTVSTVGMLPHIGQLLATTRCNLALSLFSPFSEERQQFIPAEKNHPFQSTLNVLKCYPLESKRRISLAYLLIKGINDTDRHLDGLVSLLRGSRLRVNLIPYHPIPGMDFEPAEKERTEYFFRSLNAHGVPATIRRSRGMDIAAACGQLSTGGRQQEDRCYTMGGI